MGKYRIAVIPGDGIGKEVIPQSVRAIRAALEETNGLQLDFMDIEAGGEYYLKTQREWSEEAEQFVKREADAILLGAVGAIDGHGNTVRLPDGNLAGYHVVIGLRFDLDLYANVRPVRLLEGVPTPLARKTHRDIDMVIVRENTEGLYTPARGTLARGGEPEIAIDTRVITHKGSARVIEQAFKIAEARKGRPADGKRMVTCVDKSNLLAGCQLFRYTFDQVASRYSNISRDYAYVDAWTQWCIRRPESFDVVVAPNAFGDIITDLGAAIQGGLGMAPAGNIGDSKGVFEPVHGSAPKHYGENTANPIASILAGSMMLEWLGDQNKDDHCKQAAQLIVDAVAQVLREGTIRTYDLCVGDWEQVTPSSTIQVTNAVIKTIADITD
ncbi:MAG: isocitrate/isopropylmalate dehydrogenase family protein [Candidatus Thorarchaeota archaeon]|nr:isocitrate/isopropylmalate dehydrogenase family protein [Candidatus Thorarchaeota archaeon]